MSEVKIFSTYPQFLETSRTLTTPTRLNARHEAMITSNQAVIEGKHLLDIGSHDGRWSFAAIKAGAVHVTGIEPRLELIENAQENMRECGIDEDYYLFLRDDVFHYLEKNNVEFDTILCLGYFYHTIRHIELVNLFRRTGAKHIILDTEVVPQGSAKALDKITQYQGRTVNDSSFIVQLIKDPVSDEMMAVKDEFTREGFTLVGRPSVGAIYLIFEHFGYDVLEIPWDTLLEQDVDGLHDYKKGWRKTFLCTRRST